MVPNVKQSTGPDIVCRCFSTVVLCNDYRAIADSSLGKRLTRDLQRLAFLRGPSVGIKRLLDNALAGFELSTRSSTSKKV
jgi:hypothetical protein